MGSAGDSAPDLTRAGRSPRPPLPTRLLPQRIPVFVGATPSCRRCRSEFAVGLLRAFGVSFLFAVVHSHHGSRSAPGRGSME
jgi:hypothetical protein